MKDLGLSGLHSLSKACCKDDYRKVHLIILMVCTDDFNFGRVMLSCEIQIISLQPSGKEHGPE